jgi:hypothetical protein
MIPIFMPASLPQFRRNVKPKRKPLGSEMMVPSIRRQAMANGKKNVCLWVVRSVFALDRRGQQSIAMTG